MKFGDVTERTGYVHDKNRCGAQGHNVKAMILFTKCSKGIRNYQLGIHPED
jgi:hypothetical protein